MKGYSVMVEDVAVYALIASTLGMAVWAIHTFARGVDPKTLEGLAESYFAKSLKSLCLDLGEAGVDADLTQKFRNDIMRACNVDLDSAARGAEDIKRYAYNSYARNPVRRV
ncbi:MAG TPA: hypothetical protein PK765_03050 [bacterium]|nr:hypothetical protein [bacterium]